MQWLQYASVSLGYSRNVPLIGHAIYLFIFKIGGAEKWDEMVQEANRIYSSRVHNLIADNCHSHVACALNGMELKPPFSRNGADWDMVKLCFLVFFRARFLSFGGFLAQFGPFLLLLSLIYLPIRFL